MHTYACRAEVFALSVRFPVFTGEGLPSNGFAQKKKRHVLIPRHSMGLPYMPTLGWFGGSM